MIDLPWRALADLTGALRPGLHAIGGPVASGKTQLSLQIAAHARGRNVLLLHPRIDPEEIRARVAGTITKTRWTEIEQADIPESIEIGGGRAPLEALVTEEADLFVVDYPTVDERLLQTARRAALEKKAVVLLVLEPTSPASVKSYVPASIRRGPAPEIAEWLGTPPRLMSELDTLLIVAPHRARSHGRWASVDVAVAKNRRGLPGRAPLRFNGAWFDDESDDDFDLGL